MKEPKIDKNIPLPPKAGHAWWGNRDYEEIWLKLKPGDSVFYEGPEGSGEIVQRKVLEWKRTFLERHSLNWEMTTRRVEGGVRIWRMK